MTIKFLIPALVLIFQFQSIKAQLGSVNMTSSSHSPQATSLGKYVEQPVSKYSGIPDISVRLYDFSSNQTSIPISLSYRASGIKVKEVAGLAGLGWTLNGGGVISRVIRGSSDSYGEGANWRNDYLDSIKKRVAKAYKNGFSNEFTETDKYYMAMTSPVAKSEVIDLYNTTIIDTEFDIYYYNFMGYSGRFTLNHKGKAILMPENDLKIEYIDYRFKITDSKGFAYYFNDIETTDRYHVNESISSWYISRIESPFNSKKTYFTYKDIHVSSCYNGSFFLSSANGESITTIRLIGASTTSGSSGGMNESLWPNCGKIGYNYWTNITMDQNNLIPDKIISDLDTVQFYTSNNRNDFYLWKLDSISVKTGSHFIKSIKFNYGYFNESSELISDRRLRLDSLRVDGQKYIFSYIESYNGRTLPSMITKGVDLWGYYNGEDYNDHKTRYKSYGLLNSTRNYYYYSGSADEWLLWTSSGGGEEGYYFGGASSTGKNPDYRYAQIGTLRSIQYPTGGKTIFEYEGNDFGAYSFNFPAGTTEPLERDPGTQVVFDTIQQMEVNAFFPMPLSSYGYMQKNESKELIIHSDQMVDFTLLYGMESQSTYDRYMECMFGWGVVATCNIKLSRFNDATQLFETVFEYSATPILDLNFPDNEQEFEDRKSSAFFTDNPSVFLTEGRYKLECNYEGMDISAYASVRSKFYYKSSDSLYNSGGLRIKKITFDPGDLSVEMIEKEFIYGKDGKSFGVLESPFSNVSASAYYGVSHVYDANISYLEQCNLLNIYESSIIPLGNSQGGTVGYSHVIEKTRDKGQIEYYFTTGLNTEATEHYEDRFMEKNYSGIKTRVRILEDNSWKRGLLKGVKYYDDENNLLKEEFFKYQFVHLAKDTSISVVAELDPDNFVMGGLYPFNWRFLLTTPYKALKIQDSTILYNETDQIMEVKDYEYNLFKHIYPTKITTRNSHDELLISKMTYPEDYEVGETPTGAIAQGISKLKMNHLVSPIIEQITQKSLRDGTNLKTTSATLSMYKNMVPLPDKIFQLESGSPVINFTPASFSASADIYDNRLKPFIFYDSYDGNGNLTQQHKDNNVNVSYIWGYNGAYPIAEITNATYDEVAYSGFEGEYEDSYEKWNEAGGLGFVLHDDQDAPEGKYCLGMHDNIAAAAIESQGVILNSQKKYILSFWEKGKPLEVMNNCTFLSDDVLFTRGDWHFRKIIFTGASGSLGLTTSALGDCFIDALRLYPEEAHIRTFTYLPLIGMISQCDDNDRMTYYEYDDLGRLSLIRDQDGNIVKRICYNYQGQVTDCEVLNVYVAATVENVRSSIQNGAYQEIADYYLRCYDATGQPLTLTTPIDVHMDWYRQITDSNGNILDSITLSYVYTIPAGSSSLLLTTDIQHRYYLVDENGNRAGDMYESKNILTPGVKYFIKPD